METRNAILSDAQHFASSVHAKYPHQMLAYNLSPSFNWDAAGMNDEEIKDFQHQLGRSGYVWQFITLAGFHANSLQITLFSRAFAKDYMLAYVNMIQRQENKHKIETLTHQKWSGAEFVDTMLTTITAGMASTQAMKHGNTEQQFSNNNTDTTQREEQILRSAL